MRISDWSSDVCSSDLTTWQSEHGSEGSVRGAPAAFCASACGSQRNFFLRRPCGMPGAQRGQCLSVYIFAPVYLFRFLYLLVGLRCGAPARDSEVAIHRAEDYLDRKSTRLNSSH